MGSQSRPLLLYVAISPAWVSLSFLRLPCRDLQNPTCSALPVMKALKRQLVALNNQIVT